MIWKCFLLSLNRFYVKNILSEISISPMLKIKVHKDFQDTKEGVLSQKTGKKMHHNYEIRKKKFSGFTTVSSHWVPKMFPAFLKLILNMINLNMIKLKQLKISTCFRQQFCFAALKMRLVQLYPFASVALSAIILVEFEAKLCF